MLHLKISIQQMYKKIKSADDRKLYKFYILVSEYNSPRHLLRSLF